MTRPRDPSIHTHADNADPTEQQHPDQLDLSELGRLLAERRRENNMSIRQAATEAQVSFSTLSRVEAGAHPDLATFTRLCAWLRISPSHFFVPVTRRNRSPLDEAITHLRGDPRLPEDAKRKISSMLRDLYGALADESEPPKVLLAFHLRAAAVMRPGVPSRLASLLTDMHEQLRRRAEAGQL
jgi:transcriptional regulator with XRE-family HTH domain